MTKYYIANSGHDENGNYSGGKCGDQTSEEYVIREWYSRPWTAVYRFSGYNKQMHIACWASMSAKNNCVGYNQSHRFEFWTQLEKNGYRPDKITTNCDADCSAGVACIVKAVGAYLGDDKMYNAIDVTYENGMYTGNADEMLKAAGAKKLTSSKYLTSAKYLKPGDILWYKEHMAIYVGTSADGIVLVFLNGKYKTKQDMWIRKKARGTSAKVMKENMTKTLASKCNNKGKLKSGSTVSCSKTCIRPNGNYWGKTKSGWICLQNKKQGKRVAKA